MPLSTNPKIWRILIVIFLFLTALFALAFYFKTIFITIIIGLSLIVITEKIRGNFSKNTKKLPNKIRKFYAWFLIIFWLVSLSYLMANSLGDVNNAIRENKEEYETITSIYNEKIDLYIKPYVPQIIQERIFTGENFKKLQLFFFSFSTNLFSQLSFFILNGILIIPLLFHIYFNKSEGIKKKIFSLIPKRFHKDYTSGLNEVATHLHDFFTAKVIESIVVAFICCIGFFIAGVKGWLILGLVAGFLNIVPYIGPLLGAVPPLLITLLVDEPIISLYVVITIIIAQLVDNLYLIPFMIAGKVRIFPLVSILLVLTGAQLFGIFGMVFAIPMYLVYKIVLKGSYEVLVRIYG